MLLNIDKIIRYMKYFLEYEKFFYIKMNILKLNVTSY